MAHFCYASVTDAVSSLRLRLPDTVQLGIWGGGPRGEDLDLVVTGPPIVKIDFPVELQSFPIPHLRVFELTGVGAGSTTIEARVPGGGSYAAPLRIVVGGGDDDITTIGLQKYYHGTSLENAKKLMTMELEPRAVDEAFLLRLGDYTDFGKGLYTHPEESKHLAVQWAKRNYKDWGVVRFTLTADEVSKITGQPLHFPDKFKTRPSNSPKLFNSQPAMWIEFVEFNKHIRTVTIARPKDNDWTADYPWIRGPMWGRKDSNLPGAPGPPERYHQIDWGLNGLKALNANPAKYRRFLITKHNERLL
jgi:hypothetical protein